MLTYLVNIYVLNSTELLPCMNMWQCCQHLRIRQSNTDGEAQSWKLTLLDYETQVAGDIQEAEFHALRSSTFKLLGGPGLNSQFAIY